MLINTKSSLSQIIDTCMDSVTNLSLSTTTWNALNALTTAINNHMTSSQQKPANGNELLNDHMAKI